MFFKVEKADTIIEILSKNGASELLLGVFQDLFARIERETDFQGYVDRSIAEICGVVSSIRERKAMLIHEIENRITNEPLFFSRLPWKLLPSCENVYEELISHYQKLEKKSRWKEKYFDYSRLDRIENSLSPSSRSLGEDGYEGYTVFCFNRTPWVILECPVYGNATYILKDNWETISKLSKWEVRHEHSEKVIVIRHNESWFQRLKIHLQGA